MDQQTSPCGFSKLPVRAAAHCEAWKLASCVLQNLLQVAFFSPQDAAKHVTGNGFALHCGLAFGLFCFILPGLVFNILKVNLLPEDSLPTLAPRSDCDDPSTPSASSSEDADNQSLQKTLHEPLSDLS